MTDKTIYPPLASLRCPILLPIKVLRVSRPNCVARSGNWHWSCAVTLTVALAGCAGLPFMPQQAVESSTPPGELRIPRVLANEGLRKLREHRYEDATRLFNAGLKFDPGNAHLHFLNGLSYHLQYVRGDPVVKDMAVMGYELALGIDPAYYAAAMQLGRLQFEAKRYDKSVDAFLLAAEIEPDRGEANLGAAMAAYYARDLAVAGSASAKAVALLKGDASAERTEAMIRAGLGDQAGAQAAALRYASLEADPASRSQLGRRLGQWHQWHESAPAQDGPATKPQVLAQANVPQTVAPMSMTPFPTAAPAAVPTAPTRVPALPLWSECDSTATAGQTSSGPYGSPSGSPYGSPYGSPSGSPYGSSTGGSSSSADQTTPLPALPITCKGAGRPRMAILDVVIVRTEDSAATSNGINVLNGLNFLYGISRTITVVLTSGTSIPNSTTATETRARSIAIGGTGNPATVSYSLNIANATDARSEVLAQPSLVALDRQPSTFFSGRNITLGIAGQAGGASTIGEKSVGVSLSVTPTFIDDDTMLVSAKAARSFLEQVDASITFGQTMQTSRNAVTANVALKFGETLIMSGLAEQEVQRATGGVPVLQDIPILQYLFRNKSTQNFTRSVLILITPRRPATEPEQLAKELAKRVPGQFAEKEALIQKLRTRLDTDPSMATATSVYYHHALSNRLYLQFRADDIKPDDWSTPNRLDNFFKQLGSSAYF